MPKFILPALKKRKSTDIAVSDPLIEDSWFRRVRIPGNKALVGDSAIGDEVTVVLTGKIISLESRESETSKERYEFEIEIASVEMGEDENMFVELSKDDD